MLTPRSLAYRGHLPAEYIEAAQHLRRAIAEATEAGLLGKHPRHRVDFRAVRAHRGAISAAKGGADQLSGRPPPARDQPRSGELRRLGKPTCVNNVETLCNVPAILANGVGEYQNISTSKMPAPS